MFKLYNYNIMNPLSVSVTIMVIIVIIVHVKHFIFVDQSYHDDLQQVQLSHIHTIPKQHNPDIHNIYHSFYEAYTQTCIGQKTIKMKKGEFKSEGLTFASMNDELVYNCGDDYMLSLSSGISKGKWVTNIKVFSLPHMHQIQANAIFGQLQTNLKTSCQIYKISSKKIVVQHNYQFIFSVKNLDAWTIQNIKIISNQTDQEDGINLSIEPIINMIPSKPIVVTASTNGRIYAYVTQDTPWIIDIYYYHKYFYLRKASQINVQFNGPRIFSVGQKYQATTYDNYFEMVNYNMDLMMVSNLHRIGTIIPHQLMISKKNNLIYFIYQHKNHPFCQRNALMSAAWDISFLNRNQQDEELRDSKVIDIYMNSGKVHRHQNHNPVNYFDEDQSKEHKNMQANIIGSIFQQTRSYKIDCQIRSEDNTIFNDGSGVICIYTVTGSNYLRVVQVQKQPTFFVKKQKLAEQAQNESSQNQKKRKKTQQKLYEEYHVLYQNQQQPQEKENKTDPETKTENQSKTQQQSEKLENTKATQLGDLQRSTIAFPEKNGQILSAEDFNQISILNIDNNGLALVLLSSKLSSKERGQSRKMPPYKFYELKGKFRIRQKHALDEQQINSSIRFLNRILSAAFIEEKIILFWGWGIEIYQLQNLKEKSKFGSKLPMDSLIPLIGLFATLYCMIQFLVPSQ